MKVSMQGSNWIEEVWGLECKRISFKFSIFYLTISYFIHLIFFKLMEIIIVRCSYLAFFKQTNYYESPISALTRTHQIWRFIQMGHGDWDLSVQNVTDNRKILWYGHSWKACNSRNDSFDKKNTIARYLIVEGGYHGIHNIATRLWWESDHSSLEEIQFSNETKALRKNVWTTRDKS